MKKRKKFTYEELMSTSDSIEDQKLNFRRLEFYLKIMENSSRPDLTDDEKRWVFDSILGNYTFKRFISMPEYFESKKLLLKNPYFDDQWFMFLYLQCDYLNNLNGDNIIKRHGYFGNFFSEIEHENNLKSLIDWCLNFEKTIEFTRHRDQLLQKICAEAREIIKNEFENAEFRSYCSNWRKSKRKQIILFYKYYYIRGKELFNDFDSFKIIINHTEVIFDFESYAHCSKHFAQMVKPDLLNKTYFEKDFMPLDMPKQLEKIFQEVGNKITLTIGDNTGIFFEFNSTVYKLYINLKPDNTGKKILKIMSLFPAEESEEIRKYSLLQKIKINENLFIYQ